MGAGPSLKAARWALAASFVVWAVLWAMHQQEKGRIPDTVQEALAAGGVEQLVGILSGVRRNRYGVGAWEVTNHGGRHQVLVMPNLGRLHPGPRPGDCLVVTGRWKRQLRHEEPAFYPAALAAIQAVPAGTQASCPVRFASVADAAPMVGERVWLRVWGEGAQRFRSRSGKEHLRVQMRDATGAAQGVMWEGEFTSEDIAHFRSGRPLRVFVQVDKPFRGQPSFVVWQVVPDG